MGILAWVVWGLVVGAIARLLRPGKQSISFLMTIVLGVAGSLVGGFVASELLGLGGTTNFGFGSFLIAVGTSVLLLMIWDAVERRRQPRQPGGTSGTAVP